MSGDVPADFLSNMPVKRKVTKAKTKEEEPIVRVVLADGSKTVKAEKKEKVKAVRLARAVKGYLVGDKVIVEDEEYEIALPLYTEKQFGEKHGVKKTRLEFSLTESLYLIERNKLGVYSAPSSRKALTVAGFVRLANKLEHRFWTRYRIYRELRTRGYIVKTALKFGADFRVYQRGKKPGEVHAKWVLFAANENDTYTWREFAAMNRVAHSTKKNLLLGIADDEGDVTYYEIHWKKP